MNPLIQLEDNGQVATLSYDVPEPAIYHGQVAHVVPLPPDAFVAMPAPVMATFSQDQVRLAMIRGFADPSVFPNLGVLPNYLAYVDETTPTQYYLRYNPGGELNFINAQPATPFKGVVVVGADAPDHYGNPGPVLHADKNITDGLALLTPEKVYQQLTLGNRLFITKTPTGQYDLRWVPADPPTKGIALLERYQLSTFLGNYGAGRTLQTFTLLPGEKTKITIRSYSRTTSDSKATSSILDSHTNDASNEFSNQVDSEHSDKKDNKSKQQWSVGIEAQANWGVAQVQASASYKGGMNSGREQFAKELSNALSKHATKASSKRDVQVQQAEETKTETGIEQGVVREIQNVNVGRTLNFVFRQMNQEYISILHLLDVELGYSNGYPGGVKRYSLAQLDQLLQEQVQSAYRDSAKQRILIELQNIIDYAGNAQNFIEQVAIPLQPSDGTGATYWRTRSSLTSQYTSTGGKVIANIPGIILDATETVMRTDGVMVEALLGQGDGLDEYSKFLQDAAWRASKNANDLQAALLGRRQLAATVAAAGDLTAAQIFSTLYPNQTPPPIPSGTSSK